MMLDGEKEERRRPHVNYRTLGELEKVRHRVVRMKKIIYIYIYVLSSARLPGEKDVFQFQNM